MPDRQHPDLAVIVKVKELTSYLFTVTHKSPKEYRFTLVSKMQNLCLYVISSLYRANDERLDDAEGAKARLRFQREAIVSLRELDYLLSLSREMRCLLPKQAEHAGALVFEARSMVYAWIKSDGRRFANVPK